MKSIGVLSVLLLTLSCVSNKDQIVGDNHHFNLGQFINGIDSLPKSVEKNVLYKENTETKTLQNYDLMNDLQAFSGYGLPITGVEDQFQVDTIDSGQNLQIRYIAKDEKNRLRYLHINYEQNEVQSVEIQRITRTMITTHEIYLKIMHNGNYEYIKHQKKNDEAVNKTSVVVTIQNT